MLHYDSMKIQTIGGSTIRCGNIWKEFLRVYQIGKWFQKDMNLKWFTYELLEW
jgi:hypothetical protein